MARIPDAQRAREYRARQRAKNPPLRRPGENIDRAGRPWRILTDQQVHEIRERLAASDAPSQAAIGRVYGVDASTISQIASGRRRRAA
jgi:hypothetical protein